MDQRAPLITGHEAILDRLVEIALAAGPLAAQTDKYFTNTHRIVSAHGDSRVTFAIFMRRRVVAAFEPCIRLIKRFVPDAEIKHYYHEGDVVPLGTIEQVNREIELSDGKLTAAEQEEIRKAKEAIGVTD